MPPILVTGAAGFIGYHVAARLLADGHEVLGLDCLNEYYDINLKLARVAQLEKHPKFQLSRINLADRAAMEELFATHRPETVINLAAQAGVRYSLDHPHSYIESNLVGFLNILEGCRHNGCKHLIYASSSSVYGANTTMPFSEQRGTEHPLSLYAATKKANEMMAHSYSSLYDLPTTGLRFFTVYGPFGRPDMAMFKFAKAMLEDRPIDVYNHGNMRRDFTFVGDVVEGVVRLIGHIPTRQPFDGSAPDPSVGTGPYRIFNIGNNAPVELMDMIGALERALSIKAELNMMDMQPGDVPATWADSNALRDAVGYQPATTVEEGVQRFVEWYRGYYDV